MDVVIVDDEPLACERLRRLIDRMPGYDMVGTAADGAAALTCVRAVQPDVVLLDINMPGSNGLQVAADLAELPLPPAVIFTTAFMEHALPAHDLAPAGYLLKPIQRDELARALRRASRPSRAQLQALNRGSGDAEARFISACTHNGQARVAVADVLYFWADHKYTTVYHRHGQLLISDSLNMLEQRYGDVFLRVHRKALVAWRLVTELSIDASGQRIIELRHCERALPVSRRRVAAVRRLLSS